MEASKPEQRRFPTADAEQLDALINAPARLAAVRRSSLLDSAQEESFDVLTRLAARVIGVPGSFVSIVAAGRDFYKSQTGMPAPLCDDRQTSGRTFCHFTLESTQPLVINDTHGDPTWKSIATVETLGVRAYVGVPIQLDGETIGSFCAIDTQPRAWQPDELETLSQLALSAGREIQLRAALGAAQLGAEQAQALARGREEIVAVLAHDLKTPLQVLRFSTMALAKEANEQTAAVIQRMVRAIDGIKTMSDHLLSSNALLAPSTAGRKRTAGATLLQDAVDMMRPIAERAGIRLDLGDVDQASVAVDYAQMLRALGDLLGNALKYSPAESTVRISGRVEQGFFRISLQDQGQGMSGAEQSHAMGNGSPETTGQAQADNFGLGLFIARKLTADQGGTVELSSGTGVGTTVTISLPVLD